MSNYKDGEIIEHNGRKYRYCAFYDRLEELEVQDNINIPPTKDNVLCPKCLNNEFSISYGDYECIAHCKCGHSMTIYDG